MVYGNGTIASNNKQFAHQFIIDGHCAKNYVSVNRSDYFHCVWGWGGRNNGYFLYKTDRNALGGKPNFVEKDETMPDKEDWEANIQLLLYPGMEPQR